MVEKKRIKSKKKDNKQKKEKRARINTVSNNLSRIFANPATAAILTCLDKSTIANGSTKSDIEKAIEHEYGLNGYRVNDELLGMLCDVNLVEKRNENSASENEASNERFRIAPLGKIQASYIIASQKSIITAFVG